VRSDSESWGEIVMQKRQAWFSLACLVLALNFYACSTNAWLISGELLDATGKEFVKTGLLFDRLHTIGKISDDEYKTWAKFANRFKMIYAPAVNAWLKAQTVKDKQKAAAVISAVRTELLQFVIVSASK